jgi:hypothetical protein
VVARKNALGSVSGKSVALTNGRYTLSVTRRTLRAIASQRQGLLKKPYPHLAFEKFWPEDFYRELLAKRPELDNYVQLNRENTRRQFTLFDGSCDAGDDERRA